MNTVYFKLERGGQICDIIIVHRRILIKRNRTYNGSNYNHVNSY